MSTATSPLKYQNIIENFFLTLVKEYEIKNCDSKSPKNFFSSETIFALTSIFGEPLLESAFHILDTRSITIYRLPNFLKTSQSADICEIQGSKKNQRYLLFSDINFCPCPAFEFQVLVENSINYTCKHVLALRLAKILGIYQVKTLNKEQFNFMLQQIKD